MKVSIHEIESRVRLQVIFYAKMDAEVYENVREEVYGLFTRPPLEFSLISAGRMRFQKSVQTSMQASRAEFMLKAFQVSMQVSMEAFM